MSVTHVIAWIDHFDKGTFDLLLTLGTVSGLCALARIIYSPEMKFKKRVITLFGNSLVGIVLGKVVAGIEIVNSLKHLTAALGGFIGDKIVGALVKKGKMVEKDPDSLIRNAKEIKEIAKDGIGEAIKDIKDIIK